MSPTPKIQNPKIFMSPTPPPLFRGQNRQNRPEGGGRRVGIILIATFFYNEPKIDPERANLCGNPIEKSLKFSTTTKIQNFKIIWKKSWEFFGSLYRCKIFWRIHFSHPFCHLSSVRCSKLTLKLKITILQLKFTPWVEGIGLGWGEIMLRLFRQNTGTE